MKFVLTGGNVQDLGNIDGINQWQVISNDESTNRTELLINIDEVEKYSGVVGYGGKYKLLNSKWKTF